jgi:sugar-specific transcriptional regulator TrmB
MAKFQKMFKEMLEENPELFQSFGELHDKYEKDQQKYKAEFDKLGDKVLEVIRHYEDKLCMTSERSRMSKFTTNLSELFWGLVREKYSLIDDVGVN